MIEPKRYFCHRAEYEVPFDGRLDHLVWEAAEWTDDFVDIEGDAKPAPRFRTRVKMLYDDRYFYIGAEMEEPHVWATLTEHDSVIFQDNDFEVFIDPDDDSLNYFEFEMNALNTTWDLFLAKPYRDGGSADNGWETYAETSVHIDGTLNDPSDVDRGWSCVIALPWECFEDLGGARCPPQHGDVWRINFSRVEWDTEIVDGKYVKVPNTPEHNWVWSPQGVIDMHQPETWGYVEFGTVTEDGHRIVS
ncbi:MAG: carbohydrate-binding family 9-like protein [Fimbriimonadales bacterium]